MQHHLKQLGEEVSLWSNVSVYPHRLGGTEFRFGNAEIGHIHAGGIVDIPFPRSVRDALVAEGLARKCYELENRSVNMKYRIAIWAEVGLLIAGCWGLYFAMVNKDSPINPIANSLAGITCPVGLASLHFHFPISLYWVLVVNAATYALVGLIVESVRQKLRHT